MRLKTNQQYKNINNRLKIQKGRIIDLLYKISLLKRLTKSSSSGNRMDNLALLTTTVWNIIGASL